MQFVRLGIWLLVVFSICSCRKEQTVLLGEDCSVALKLQADYAEHEVVLTRAGVDTPPLDSFHVRIENTKAEVLKTWKYSELPNLIKVVPGSYKLVAWYGSEENLPVFDKAYYYGERKLTLKDGDNLDTTVIAARAATKVAVAFHESFDFDYTDYFVDIKTEGDSLRFLKDEKRAGYFKPGKLRMRFGLKIKGEDFYREFYPSAIASVKGREFYNFTLKVQTTNGALSGFIISTDSSTIEIPVDVELPPMYLPKKAPVVNLTGDGVENGKVETNEGIHKKAMFTVSSMAGLTKLKLQTTCPSLVEKGWPAEVNLMELTPEQKTVLAKHGLEWSEELNTKDTIKNMVWVRFDNVVKLMTALSGSQTNASFKIIANDRLGQLTDSVLTVTVNPPIFRFVTPANEGNVFARRAIYDIEYQSEVHKPVMEVLQGASWTSLTTELKDKGNNQYECSGIGLTPNTSCQIRIRLGEHILSVGTYTTEEELQVPNGNMEEWSEEMVWKRVPMGGREIFAFYPYKSGETNPYWNTRNRKTTQRLADYSWYYGAYPGTVPTSKTSWTAAKHLNDYDSKTLPTNSHGGTSAMEISTVGWGKNNWASGQPNTQYRTAGCLYIGSYDLENHVEQYGHPFAARPMAIEFYYRFYSYNEETTKVYAEVKDVEGNLIGKGELKITKSVDNWQLGHFDIVYTTFNKAASLSLVFLSTDAAEPSTKAVKGNAGAFGGYGDSRHIGSILTVDDISLVY